MSTNKKDLSIFQNTVRTFEHMIEEIFERIENNIIADVTLDIIEYKKLKYVVSTYFKLFFNICF